MDINNQSYYILGAAASLLETNHAKPGEILGPCYSADRPYIACDPGKGIPENHFSSETAVGSSQAHNIHIS